MKKIKNKWINKNFFKRKKKFFLTESASHVCVLSRVQLFATPWIVACQAPVYGILQARALERVPVPSPQGTFPTQGLNPHLCLLYGQAASLQLGHLGSQSVWHTW